MLHLSNKKWLLTLVQCAFLTVLVAQDDHYSQQFSAPARQNPAFTGLFDGQIRMTATYRDQWRNIDADFRSIYFGMDFKAVEVPGNGVVNVGFHFNNDQAGDLELSHQEYKASVSFTQALNRTGDHFFALGFSAGMLSQGVNFRDAVIFDSEPLIQNGRGERSNWDLSAGVLWHLTDDRSDARYFIGASLHHLNTPNVSFSFVEDEAIDNALKRRFDFLAGAEVTLTDAFKLLNSVRLSMQEPHQEIVAGAMLKWSQDDRRIDHLGLGLGAWLRMNTRSEADAIDALILGLRLEKKRFAVTMSYDINVSSLSKASNGFGGPEVTLSGAFGWEKSPTIRCPRI